MNDRRVVVSYAGVHDLYQIALASDELGELRTFFCTLYDGPGKWGGLIAKFLGHDRLVQRRADGLDVNKVVEVFWPIVRKVLRDKVYRRRANDWLSLFSTFDRLVAKRLEKTPSEIFVGGAASSLHCLTVAKRSGSRLVHACPGLHPHYQERLLRYAAEMAGIKRNEISPESSEWEARKLIEYSLADVLLVYSDIHQKSFEELGFAPAKLFVSPLWVDTAFWRRGATLDAENRKTHTPLKILFAGSIELRKGIPFLLDAIAACGKAVQLTIVGSRNDQSDLLLRRIGANVRCLPAVPKPQLREIYQAHDLFILPSVCDSFGFVALEAMACGLPVIVTQNCGVPVPDKTWRVPAMDSLSLAKRIMHYADDPTLIMEHGRAAAAFAVEFGPEKYRRNIRDLLKKLLGSTNASC